MCTTSLPSASGPSTWCSVEACVHLQNPLKALTSMRSVTKGMAIIETLVEREIDEKYPDKPWLSFGHREGEEKVLGEEAIYWRFGTRGLQRMMQYAGFNSSDPQGYFTIPPTSLDSTVVIAYPGGESESGGRGVGAIADSASQRERTRKVRRCFGRARHVYLQSMRLGLHGSGVGATARGGKLHQLRVHRSMASCRVRAFGLAFRTEPEHP